MVSPPPLLSTCKWPNSLIPAIIGLYHTHRLTPQTPWRNHRVEAGSDCDCDSGVYNMMGKAFCYHTHYRIDNDSGSATIAMPHTAYHQCPHYSEYHAASSVYPTISMMHSSPSDHDHTPCRQVDRLRDETCGVAPSTNDATRSMDHHSSMWSHTNPTDMRIVYHDEAMDYARDN